MYTKRLHINTKSVWIELDSTCIVWIMTQDFFSTKPKRENQRRNPRGIVIPFERCRSRHHCHQSRCTVMPYRKHLGLETITARCKTLTEGRLGYRVEAERTRKSRRTSVKQGNELQSMSTKEMYISLRCIQSRYRQSVLHMNMYS